ncbi:Kelch repeat-containing protein [Tellurirhabdus rosea]|uniref:Kelch repeat-containing protein n=1 Tax=Tellurirhabdus rosea TaxID=2674997 RepID=UPI002259CB3A|nr:kelch repeat-containing protein [Tellurirhabdus rosea]
MNRFSFGRRPMGMAPRFSPQFTLSEPLIFRYTAFLLALVWAGMLVGCSNSDDDVSTLGDWRRRSDFEGVARNAATGFVIGTIAYMGTGTNADNERLSDFWAYDPARNTWTQVANFAGTPRNAAVGFAIGNKGYVGTGLNANSDRLNDFWEYDPAANRWKRIADFGGTARRNAVAFALGSKGYVGTGFDGNYLKDFWAYDPAGNTWTKVASYGGAKRIGAVSFVINGLAYVGTGNNNGTAEKDWWAYDPAQDLWIEKDNFSSDELVARSYGVGFAIKSRGYVTVGDGNTTVWQYNPDDDSWATQGTFEGATRQYAFGFAINGKGYLTTGSSGTGRFDDLWEFDPTVAQDTDED